MNLILLGMQQNSATTPAGIIHRMFACPKHGWSLQNDTDPWCGDYLQGHFPSGHDVASGSAGSSSNEMAGFFPNFDDLAVKKLSGLFHGCFVVLTFKDLRRLPNVVTFIKGVNAIGWHDAPAQL